MLTESQVLNYIKVKLATPYIPLELEDEQILQIVRIETIPFFSRYIPDKHEVTIDLTDDTVKTDVSNEYYIIDPDGLDIISVVKIYIDMGSIIITGHPIYGMFGGDYRDVVQFALQVDKANTVSPFSAFNVSLEWIKPNKIRITPDTINGKVKVVYEREHKQDFTTIPSEFKTHFLNLAYADVALQIAKIRTQFREFQTPFGTIELNPEKLEEEAREIKDRFIEELRMFNPVILIDRG